MSAKLQRAEDQLKLVFDTNKDDGKALRKALQTAKNAGLTSAFSNVVRDVGEFLGKVMMAVCKMRFIRFKCDCAREMCCIYTAKIAYLLEFR